MRKALRLSAGRAPVNLTSEQCSPVCFGRMEAPTSCTSLEAVAKKLTVIERERCIYISTYICNEAESLTVSRVRCSYSQLHLSGIPAEGAVCHVGFTVPSSI